MPERRTPKTSSRSAANARRHHYCRSISFSLSSHRLRAGSRWNARFLPPITVQHDCFLAMPLTIYRLLLLSIHAQMMPNMGRRVSHTYATTCNISRLAHAASPPLLRTPRLAEMMPVSTYYTPRLDYSSMYATRERCFGIMRNFFQ